MPKLFSAAAGVSTPTARPAIVTSPARSHRGTRRSTALGRSAVRAAAVDALEDRRLFSVSYDAAGFTVVTPTAADRVYYVSASGSDANSGLSASAPLKTIAKAKGLVRSGYGDQLLLKRGDTFREAVGTWTKGGASADDPMVFGAYGTGSRPVVATGKASAMTTGSSSSKTTNHLVIQGIKFWSDARDPTSPTFAGASGGNEGVRLLAGTNDLLVEDVAVDSYTTNVTLTGYFGPMSNVRIRRCVITDAYNTAGHAQGVF
ncbi:MAG: hypothetical protein JWO31_3461, partial [Phycisphaerales bacterium]|nr:hypothetical protein [Phycisphaerales bacterium]